MMMNVTEEQSINSAELKTLLDDLRGTEKARADGNFFFLGNKSDLSYFWKKTDNKNHSILLREYVDSISDEYIRKGTISALTQAQADGFLSFDGTAYAITEKGKNTIYSPAFIANRLDGEEKFLKKATEILGGNLEGINKGDKMFVFTNGTDAYEYIVTCDAESNGETYIGFYSKERGELWLPKDSIGEIAFTDKEKGLEHVKKDPEKAAEWQEFIK